MSQGQQPVVVVSDTLAGGAAAATNRLVEGLTALPMMVERWHFSPSPPFPVCPGEVSLDPRRKRPPLERLLKNVSRRLANHMRRRRHEAAFYGRVKAAKPGVINLHNIHTCGLNHDSLLRLPSQIPLIWTLHDCWPFRPEAFLWENSGLRRVEAVCVDEPKQEAMRRRHAFFEQRPSLVLVAPSKWMATEARASTPEGMRIEHIPYGVCLKTFAPLPSDQMRSQLNLDPQRTWLGYSSTWASTRKGTDILLRALKLVDHPQLGLILWGEDPNFNGARGNVEVRTMGRVDDLTKMRQLYSACDLFICPSRADNLPNTVLESLACGTPVVGSRVGGIPDMARPGETGWVFEPDSAENCAAALRQALAAKGDWPRYRQACRRIAEAEYGLAVQATRYLKLFNELRHSGQS